MEENAHMEGAFIHSVLGWFPWFVAMSDFRSILGTDLHYLEGGHT